LQEAELTKDDIRILSKELGLPTWDKPAMACLASRIPYGSPVTMEKLRMVDSAEDRIRDLGIGQVRVRHFGDLARIEVEKNDIPVVRKELDSIRRDFKQIGFQKVEVDPNGYRMGSLNEGLLSSGRGAK
jgi:uncharacterized protein